MIVTFLGTGTSVGVPMIGCECPVCLSPDPRDKRMRTSILLQEDDRCIIFDVGPDFRRQMLNADVKKLDAVVFTHAHKDHTGGLDDIRPYYFYTRRGMPIYLEDSVRKDIEEQYSYMFKLNEEYTGKVPEFQFNTIGLEPFTVAGFDLIPIRLMHGPMAVLGFRIGDFGYLTDTNHIPDSEYSKLKGLKYLVLDAAVRHTHPSHFSIEEALNEVDRIQPEKAFFIHMSHKVGTHAATDEELPANVFLSYDGLQLHC